MEKAIRLRILGSLAIAAALALPTGSAMAAAQGAMPYTCTGGDLASGTFTSIPSGNYASITVAGVCNIKPDAVISVVGNINVAAGAALDAQSAPSTITVGHNVIAAPGSLLGMGCQPSNTIGRFAGVPCATEPNGHTTISVHGNVTATDANTVVLRKLTAGGNITLSGGGGAIPWSIKGNTIGRNLTISGVAADWLGVQFNKIGGNATLINITALDPIDPGRTIAVVENTVGRNLICMGLAPGVSGGIFPGEVNHVGHKALGQCASLV
ncbi:MAG TPA: hypothetical protein VE011_04660 [Candidatus Dormibacteraeota bacterium]|nr:hypothetical protein [Candidatus Dormibacteraeota bacterium]